MVKRIEFQRFEKVMTGIENNVLNIELTLLARGSDLQARVLESIKSGIEEFMPYCERLMDEGMTNVTVTLDEGTQIEEFRFDGDSNLGTMSFNFLVDYFSPCKDLRDIDYHYTERNFDFRVDEDSNKIIFDEIELPIQWQPDLAMEDY